MTAPGSHGRRIGGSRLAALAVIVLGTAGVVGGSIALSTADHSVPSVRPSTSPITGSSAPRPVLSADPVGRAYLDAKLPDDITDPLGPASMSPTFQIDGRWWAALLDPASRETRLYELGADGTTWRDTGRVLDERPDARVDVVWTGKSLYVASVVPSNASTSGIRINRYKPDAKTGFVQESDFPVAITDRGVGSLSFARDSTGRLWIAFVEETKIVLVHSLDSDFLWSPPIALPGEAAVGPRDSAVLLPYGTGQLGIAWSSVAGSIVRFATRADSSDPAIWSQPETVSEGVTLQDGPISVAAQPDGGVVVGIAGDTRASVGGSLTSARIVVARRDAAGGWSSAVAGRVEDRHDGVAVAVDPTNSEIDLLMMRNANDGTSWVMKRSTTGRLEFDAGPGLAVTAGTPTGAELSAPHLAKGPADPATGVLVVGFDPASHRYLHAIVQAADIAAGSPPPTPSGPPPAAAALPLLLVDDTFEPYALGTKTPEGWTVSNGALDTNITVASAPGRGRVLHLVSTAGGETRACKTFATVDRGRLTAFTVVRASANGTTDGVMISLRFHGDEAVTTRFGQGGTFAYYAGQTKVRTLAVWEPGVWYRSTVVVDLTKRTWEWTLTKEGFSRVIIRAVSIPFRETAAKSVGSVCVQTAAGRAGLGLDVDRVVVSR